MSTKQIGPRESALREMREARAAQREQKNQHVAVRRKPPHKVKRVAVRDKKVSD